MHFSAQHSRTLFDSLSCDYNHLCTVFLPHPHHTLCPSYMDALPDPSDIIIYTFWFQLLSPNDMSFFITEFQLIFSKQSLMCSQEAIQKILRTRYKPGIWNIRINHNSYSKESHLITCLCIPSDYQNVPNK